MQADDERSPDSTFDPSRCPLCGASNACGAVAGAEDCWCFSVEIADRIVDRIPEAARGVACLCRRCALHTESERARASGEQATKRAPTFEICRSDPDRKTGP